MNISVLDTALKPGTIAVSSPDGNYQHELDSLGGYDSNLAKSCVLDLASPLYDPTNRSKIYDRSGKNNHGTIYGALWARLPGGLWVQSFDGVDDYDSIPDADSLDTIRAFEVWVNPVEYVSSGICYHIIINKGATWINSLGVVYTTDPNALFVYWYDSANNTSEVSYGIPAYNKFYHAVGMLNSNMRAELFVNGVSKGAGAVLADNADAGFLTEPVRVGGGNPDRYSKVKIALARAYNIPPDITTIRNHYQQERYLFGV